MSYWQAVYFCVVCDKEVSKKVRLHNDGVCPHCGAHNDSTIVDTKVKVAR